MPTYDLFRGAATAKFGDYDIIATIGGVRFTYEVETEDIYIDQEDAPVDTIVTRQNAQVELECAEIYWDVLGQMPGITLVTDSVDTTKKRIEVSGEAGGSLAQNALQLTITPKDTTRTNRVLIFPHSVLVPQLTLAYSKDDNQVTPMTVKAIKTGDGEPLFKFGDQTAVAAG